MNSAALNRQAAVRPFIVIIEPMVFSDSAGMSYAHEPVHIQAFVPELAVETLHIGLSTGLPDG